MYIGEVKMPKSVRIRIGHGKGYGNSVVHWRIQTAWWLKTGWVWPCSERRKPWRRVYEIRTLRRWHTKMKEVTLLTKCSLCCCNGHRVSPWKGFLPEHIALDMEEARGYLTHKCALTRGEPVIATLDEAFVKSVVYLTHMLDYLIIL